MKRVLMVGDLVANTRSGSEGRVVGFLRGTHRIYVKVTPTKGGPTRLWTSANVRKLRGGLRIVRPGEP